MKNPKINLNNAFDHHMRSSKRQSALKWTVFNIAMLAILVFDINKSYKEYGMFWYYLEIGASFVLSLSLFKNIITYVYYTFFVDLVVCENEDQRILLNLSSSNSLIKSKTQTAVQKQDTDSGDTIWGSVKSLSWQSWGDCKLIT